MRKAPFIYLVEQPAGVSGAHLWSAVFGLVLEFCPRETVPPGYEADRFEERRLCEHADFVAMLSRQPELTTFSLRYICANEIPETSLSGNVEIAFLGKVVRASSTEAENAAVELASEVLALLHAVFPAHRWSALSDQAEFLKVWDPFDWHACSVAEIRRREDHLQPWYGAPPVSDLGESSDAPGVFVISPFVGRPSTLARLLRVLLQQSAPVVYQATIAPVALAETEKEELTEAVQKCENVEQAIFRNAETSFDNSPPPDARRIQSRAVATALTHRLMRLGATPFLLNISVASSAPLPRTLLEAIGVEITKSIAVDEGSFDGVTGRLYRGGFDVTIPDTAVEAAAARSNAQSLQFRPWGTSKAPLGLRRLKYLVEPSEAAAAFRIPTAAEDYMPGVRVRQSRILPMPRESLEYARHLDPSEKALLGYNRTGGQSQPVHLSDRDRQQHVYVVGQTGTGKTTLLKSMILSDIAAGKGVALLDPHGDLFEELLESIPAHRAADVVILDPTDIEFPVGLNLFEWREPDNRFDIVREFRSVLERLLFDQYGHAAKEYTGPIFYQHVQMNTLLATSNPDDPGTLIEFAKIFGSPDYWRRWLPLKWNEPRLADWVSTTLKEIDYTKKGTDALRLGDYIGSKFEDFLSDPRIRLIFGQKRSTINLREIMDTGKILLVNLDKGVLTEANSRFLGLVLMSKIQMAAMERSILPRDQRRMFYLYVDEFQSIATENFVLMLSEARKFGVSLVLANQFLSQIQNPKIMESIVGNVGTTICFRMGADDAKTMASQFQPYINAGDLARLPNWNAYIRTTAMGQSVPPMSVETPPPQATFGPALAKAIRDASRRRYGTPRAEAERIVAGSYLPLPEFIKARNVPVEYLELSPALTQMIRGSGLFTIQHLCHLTEKQVTAIVGEKEAKNIAKILTKSRLSLAEEPPAPQSATASDVKA